MQVSILNAIPHQTKSIHSLTRRPNPARTSPEGDLGQSVVLCPLPPRSLNRSPPTPPTQYVVPTSAGSTPGTPNSRLALRAPRAQHPRMVRSFPPGTPISRLALRAPPNAPRAQDREFLDSSPPPPPKQIAPGCSNDSDKVSPRSARTHLRIVRSFAPRPRKAHSALTPPLHHAILSHPAEHTRPCILRSFPARSPQTRIHRSAQFQALDRPSLPNPLPICKMPFCAVARDAMKQECL